MINRLLKISGVILLFLFFASCADKQEARYPVSHKSGSFLKRSIEVNKQLIAIEESKFDSIMKVNSQNEYYNSEKGFWYYYVDKVENDSIMPETGDLVFFDYTVQDIEGKTIYKKNELKTKEYLVDKEDIIIGLRYGIKQMKEGETVTFLFPSHVAYGYIGDKKKIGANTPIVCTVTLLDIQKKNQ